jgi:hypothetical protein
MLKTAFAAVDRFEDSPLGAMFGVAVLMVLTLIPLMMPESGMGMVN